MAAKKLTSPDGDLLLTTILKTANSFTLHNPIVDGALEMGDNLAKRLIFKNPEHEQAVTMAANTVVKEAWKTGNYQVIADMINLPGIEEMDEPEALYHFQRLAALGLKGVFKKKLAAGEVSAN